MKYQDEFNNPRLARLLSDDIYKINHNKQINLMEVCGTHTHAISRFGIRQMIPDWINLLSGPGCPVCVTDNEYLDQAIALARIDKVTITTFGDMFRVPGSSSSLQIEKSKGSDIRMVYSPFDALEMARRDKSRTFIFLAVGFETTAPGIAATVLQAKNDNIANFVVLPGFKTLPGALNTLASTPSLRLDGLIAPGHLSVITGTALYDDLLAKHGIPSVITGFESLDILESIRLLAQMISSEKPRVFNEYSRAVRDNGNPKATALLNKVFEPADSLWRGLGMIPDSGLKLRDNYSGFDALRRFSICVPPPIYPEGCLCGKILTGTASPYECKHFGKRCTPESPVGACMVSSEGTCAAFYRYRNFTGK